MLTCPIVIMDFQINCDFLHEKNAKLLINDKSKTSSYYPQEAVYMIRYLIP